MFQSIYSSKLYRMSPRKDRIEAAFNDPINSELVGQLAKALDEEYQTPENLIRNFEDSENSASEAEPNGSESNISEDSTDTSVDLDVSTSIGKSASNLDSKVSEEVSQEDRDASDSDTPTVEPSENNDIGNPDSGSNNSVVEESADVKGTPVVASLMRNMFRDMRQVSDEIKGMLNFKDSTAGVNRILCKENELWIYYNDDVNLNNVMGDVIELLNAANYTYLEFNRLARSDNAIVFLIEFACSPYGVQSDPISKES